MVLACESLFSRTSLDGRPQNLHTFSKVNLKYTKCSFPVGQARCSFHLPHSYNLQILLARGNLVMYRVGVGVGLGCMTYTIYKQTLAQDSDSSVRLGLFSNPG